ncbi:EcoKI restriction-modification system protein HsdS [Serratia fonticola]|uniref:restriction endonuclease subunit S n=1 Tax=Serratia fonticola TaxID=47917 RepID=UPI002182AD8F|nr:restriction endonuclease subunit S [Serratia fonticola]CAI2155543.1 EcoKI restriction-modification system protein HsdS [Serratia fonticola]
MVPKLRFAGFNEPWSETSFGNISSFITSGSRDWAQYYSDSGDKFIRMTNLVRDGITLNLSDLKFVRLPENSNEGKRTALQHHDILISITAELGKLGWVPDDLGTAYINQHTALVRPNLSITSSKFIANLLSTKKYNNILNQHNDAGAKSGLNLGTIKQFSFYAPNKTEQTKIADFLSSVDEKIALLNKQYQLLCQYKKGLLQKVFSQKFKFKDKNGKDFPEWIRTSLEMVSDVRDGTHSSPIAQLDGYPLITSKNLIGSRGIDFDNITYISKKDYDEINKRSLVSEGDLLFSMIGTIGNLALVKGSGFAIKNVGLIKELSKLKNKFLFFYLQFLVGTGYFELIKSGNTQKFISLSTLRKLEIPCPIINEQIIIAKFFYLIDEKIAVKKMELDKLKTWKQGLFQQMFV